MKLVGVGSLGEMPAELETPQQRESAYLKARALVLDTIRAKNKAAAIIRDGAGSREGLIEVVRIEGRIKTNIASWSAFANSVLEQASGKNDPWVTRGARVVDPLSGLGALPPLAVWVIKLALGTGAAMLVLHSAGQFLMAYNGSLAMTESWSRTLDAYKECANAAPTPGTQRDCLPILTAGRATVTDIKETAPAISFGTMLIIGVAVVTAGIVAVKVIGEDR